MKNPIKNALPSIVAVTGILTQAGLCQDGQSDAPMRQPLESASPAVAEAISGLRVPIHTAAPDPVHGAYGVWAAGPGYKVSFHDGMSFVPYLGEDYPVDMPVRWRTSSVRVGGRELINGEEPVRWHDDYRYEYRFGSFVEAYDVRVDGLEQTFVFARPPAGGGPLVVTGSLTTPLHVPRADAAHQALTLRDDSGRAVVDYGSAVAFDATGRTTRVDTCCEGGELSLTVPATWLAEARYPVTIDPVLTPRVINSNNNTFHGLSEIARDHNSNSILVVYSVAASGSDRDVYAVLMRDDWSNRTVVFSDLGSWTSPEVSCAAAGGTQYFMLAFTRRNNVSSSVRYQTRRGLDFTFSSSVRFPSSVAGGHEWRPVVGGTQIAATGKFMLVYQREMSGSTFGNVATSKIVARTVELDGTPNSEFDPTLALPADRDRERPAITRSVSGTSKTRWVVAWQEFDNTDPVSPNWQVRARSIYADHTVSLKIHFGEGRTTSLHRVGIKIAGDQGRYLLTYCLLRIHGGVPYPSRPSSNYGDVFCTQRVDWTGVDPVPQNERVIAGDSDYFLAVGGVAYDNVERSHWAIQLVSDRTVGGDGSAAIFRIGYQGLVTEAALLQAPPTPSHSALPGAVFFDVGANAFLTCWAMNGDVSKRVNATRYTYDPSLRSQQGVSCSAASIWAESRATIGNEFFRITLTGGPPQQPAFLLLAAGTVSIPLNVYGMPGCRLLVANVGPQHIGMVTTGTDASGAASLQLPLPETLVPFTLFAQWIHVSPGANQAGLETTQRLRVVLVD